LLLFALVSCSAPAAAGGPVLAANATPASFSDPFTYCTSVQNADTPDAGYTGPKMPDTILKGLKKASGASSDAPDEMFTRGGFWRCMDGKVYACFVGANLPCESKANIDKTPTAADQDFCKANPSADFIPAAVSGHDTIYAWACKDGKAEIAKQVFQVDKRGYIAEIWYLINPQ
jgi:hypothetical protein